MAKIIFADVSIHKTYFKLRLMTMIALVAMPLLIALVGKLLGYALQDSLSDYYFVIKDGGLPRVLFVIFLAFLGGVLIAYYGLDKIDNLIHNFAGVFAFSVAIFPMKCVIAEHPFCEPGLLPTFHGWSAGLLYLSATCSVLYGGGPNLKNNLDNLPDPARWKKKLFSIQVFSIILMLIGILTFFLHQKFRMIFPSFSWIFWIEYLGFLGFGIYWFRLMLLIVHANEVGSGQLIITNARGVGKCFYMASSMFRGRGQPALPINPQWTPIP